jgi:hypothetical protein
MEQLSSISISLYKLFRLKARARANAYRRLPQKEIN